MNAKITYIILNGGLAACLYMGFVFEISGAYNVAMAMAWFSIVCAALTTIIPDTELPLDNRSFPKLVTRSFDFAVGIVFLWFGAIVTGIFFLIHILLIEILWDRIEKAKSRLPKR